MAGDKAGPRLMRFEALDFVPRAERGEMAQLAEVSGTKDGSPLGTGFVRLTKALKTRRSP
jgi:dihydroxyacetone kinase DhaKLM complex PTS-EIIA-like component DhaM